MNNYFYFVVGLYEEDENGKQKRFAYAEKVHGSNELLSYFGRKDIQHVNPVKTFKEAKEIAEFWNDCYKKNGTYMFAR